MSETAVKQKAEATQEPKEEKMNGQKEGQEIFRNEQRIKARIRQAERILRPIEELFKQMEQDGITPTVDELRNFMSGGPDYIKKQLSEMASKAVKSLKIKNKKVESTLIENTAGVLSDSYARLHYLLYEKQTLSGIDWGDILVLKGKPMLSEAFKKRIENEFSATLDTADKQEFWNKLQDFCDSFNRMEELAQKTGLPSMRLHINREKAVFLKIEEEGFFIRVKPNPAGFINIFEV